MTQINFTLDSEQIQDIISNSGANDLAKQMLTTIFNQLMEKERDEYINADNHFATSVSRREMVTMSDRIQRESDVSN